MQVCRVPSCRIILMILKQMQMSKVFEDYSDDIRESEQSYDSTGYLMVGHL